MDADLERKEVSMVIEKIKTMKKSNYHTFDKRDNNIKTNLGNKETEILTEKVEPLNNQLKDHETLKRLIDDICPKTKKYVDINLKETAMISDKSEKMKSDATLEELTTIFAPIEIDKEVEINLVNEETVMMNEKPRVAMNQMKQHEPMKQLVDDYPLIKGFLILKEITFLEATTNLALKLLHKV